jgi:hypothetical protein
MMVTCGFMTYEIIYFRPMTKQIFFHHIFGIICLVCGCITGYAMTGLGSLSLICEFSTVFLNYRGMVAPEYLNDPLPMVNQIVFFLTFTLTRIFFLPFLFVLELKMLWNLWDYLNHLRKFTGLTCAIMSLLMNMINFYWYSLILKGVFKLLNNNPKKITAAV